MTTNGNEFAWLIEAPGPRYLSTQNAGGVHFKWTADHNEAIRFYSIQQADAVMEAVRNLDRQINGFDKGLFAFEATLGNARPVENGWMGGPSGTVVSAALSEESMRRGRTV